MVRGIPEAAADLLIEKCRQSPALESLLISPFRLGAGKRLSSQAASKFGQNVIKGVNR